MIFRSGVRKKHFWINLKIYCFLVDSRPSPDIHGKKDLKALPLASGLLFKVGSAITTTSLVSLTLHEEEEIQQVQYFNSPVFDGGLKLRKSSLLMYSLCHGPKPSC